MEDSIPSSRTVPTEMPAPARKAKLNGIDLTDMRFKEMGNVARSCRTSQFIHHFISVPAYKISSVLAVFLALFLVDFTRCALSPEVDTPIDIIMLLVFFFLMCDVILQSIAYPKYLFSMFFWLDFLGTLTLLADMDLALSLVGQSYSDLTVARGGRAGRAARSAGSLRIGRIVMWARIGRIVRVARVMRVARLISDENTQKLRREERQLMKRFSTDSEELVSDCDTDADTDTDLHHEQSPVLHRGSSTDRKFSITSDLSFMDPSVATSNLTVDGHSSCAIAQKVLDEDDQDSDSIVDSARSMRNHLDREHRVRQFSAWHDPEKSRHSGQEVVDQVYRKTHSSKIGITVADSITRDVVFGILLTVGLTPIFNGAIEETYSAMWSATEWLDYCIESESVNAEASMNEYIEVFLAQNTDIVSLTVDGYPPFKHDASMIDGLRDTEMRFFEGDNVEIVLDCHQDIRFGHGMNIGFTMVIVALFAGLAFLITRSISRLVVHPIERMTRIIQEFTKRIVFLGGDMEDQTKVVESLMETTVIEAAIATLTNIFNAITKQSSQPQQGLQRDQDPHGPLSASPQSSSRSEQTSPNRYPMRGSIYHDPRTLKSFTCALPKSEAMTKIKTRESVITFNITEKKRVFISEEEIQQKLQQIKDSGDINTFCVTVERFPELRDVSTAMCHPIASEYFRSYCASVQALENYTFVQSVQTFHEEVCKKFYDIWTLYFANGAPSQITTQASKRRKLWEQFESNKFKVSAFDDFRKDILESMQSSIFTQFVSSPWAMAYVDSHMNVKRRFSHLNLESYDQHRPPSPDIASAINTPFSPKRVQAIIEE